MIVTIGGNTVGLHDQRFGRLRKASGARPGGFTTVLESKVWKTDNSSR